MTLNNKLFPRGTREETVALGTSQNDGITSHGTTKKKGLTRGRGREKRGRRSRSRSKEIKRERERRRKRWRQDNGGRGKAAFITEHGHDGQSNGHLVPSLLSARFVLLPWRNPGPN